MLFPSSTFLKMFYKRKKLIKQTSHCLFSGTYSVSSCNVYREVPVFLLLYVILCKYFFTLLLILKMNDLNYYESKCHWKYRYCLIITKIMHLQRNIMYLHHFFFLPKGDKVFPFL